MAEPLSRHLLAAPLTCLWAEYTGNWFSDRFPPKNLHRLLNQTWHVTSLVPPVSFSSPVCPGAAASQERSGGDPKPSAPQHLAWRWPNKSELRLRYFIFVTVFISGPKSSRQKCLFPYWPLRTASITSHTPEGCPTPPSHIMRKWAETGKVTWLRHCSSARLGPRSLYTEAFTHQ